MIRLHYIVTLEAACLISLCLKAESPSHDYNRDIPQQEAYLRGCAEPTNKQQNTVEFTLQANPFCMRQHL